MTLALRIPCFLALTSVAIAASSTTAPVSAPRLFHPGGGQIFYFVLTDRFANGDTTNDTGGMAGDRDEHGFDPTVVSHFHGGDFAGLTARIDYIKELGATAIWVTPPFRNKPVQTGSAAYHGYWILDFLQSDPHLGTDAGFREFVAQVHARGLKVYLDVIVNHTADVIQYQGGDTAYVSKTIAPNRDARGRPFDERAVAFNGLNSDTRFPTLSAGTSFGYVPVVPPGEVAAKNPAWLNDVTLYHNRGNSTFEGESSLDGDFSGLDDTFTEHPAVIRGFIDIYRHWVEAYGVDGFRIDTARHVNVEFWQAFAPAIRESARRAGRPGFIQFGEVANDVQDVPLLSEFSTTALLDTTLDFGFFRAALAFVSQGKSAVDFAALFAQDDHYTDHDGNVHATTTFLGNHDAGRFAYFLQKDNPEATREQLADLVQLGHALLFLVRGQPVVYYGDEQGMIGRGGGDMQAREDMFPAQAPDFKNAALLGTTRTGADDKFDPQHPFYQSIRSLAQLRSHSPALSRGAMIVRPTSEPDLFAFSRIERGELREYLAVFNKSRATRVSATVQTSQPADTVLERVVFAGGQAADAGAALTTDAAGRVTVTLAPLQFALWRATAPLPVPTQAPTITFAKPASAARLAIATREVDGHQFAIRQELRADVHESDGVAEVTFVLERRSRPGQYELLGTDDAPPFRVFWQPPSDLAAGEELAFIATVDDLRGHRVATRIEGLTVDTGGSSFGLQGAAVPRLTSTPKPALRLRVGEELRLAVAAEGTTPLEYQWLKDGIAIAGATDASCEVGAVTAENAGRYVAIVRNRAGSVISPESEVTVTAP